MREGHEDEEPVWTPLRVQSPLDERTERILNRTIGCAISVHRALGPGFLESIYKRAMRIELEACHLRAGLLINCREPTLKAGLRRLVL
jgi:hypothetical protein